MLDLGLTKIAILGTVALIVVGPERLPRVARTVGALVGRAQRYMSDIKAEVSREIQLDELKSMHASVREAAHTVQNSIHAEISRTQGMFSGALSDSPTASPPTASPSPSAATVERDRTRERSALPMSPQKRTRWRINRMARQRATPIWFKHQTRGRTRVLSAAARVARYRRPHRPGA